MKGFSAQNIGKTEGISAQSIGKTCIGLCFRSFFNFSVKNIRILLVACQESTTFVGI